MIQKPFSFIEGVVSRPLSRSCTGCLAVVMLPRGRLWPRPRDQHGVLSRTTSFGKRGEAGAFVSTPGSSNACSLSGYRRAADSRIPTSRPRYRPAHVDFHPLRLWRFAWVADTGKRPWLRRLRISTGTRASATWRSLPRLWGNCGRRESVMLLDGDTPSRSGGESRSGGFSAGR